ncbi:hypothetical protein [Rhodoferax sp.]|uniref:hypothetical protein n=1 Tax=Rhodoferax sp. TaxID=50421 RepID=UPI002622E937|nr:hypothetical protein [Rhodoferax sp.]MDD2918501.1 hypothetical protein [Rhodoferax sp.]
MCIIIDTNTLSKVFKTTDKKHSEFKPVLDWIKDGNGKIIVGGTTFNNEILVKVQWFVKAYQLLRQCGKVVEIDMRKVDKQEAWLKKQITDDDFDDPHIVALIGISGCKLVCTGDARSFPYIQNKKLYPKGKVPPSIYTKASNKQLLCDSNLAPCCLPKLKLSKTTKQTLTV